MPSPGGGTGYFRLAKQGSQWNLVTPEGHAFWMLGVAAVDPSAFWVCCIFTKYYHSPVYTADFLYMNTITKRLKSWNFNSLGDKANVELTTSFISDPHVPYVRFPFILVLNVSSRAVAHWGLPISEPVKDIAQGISPTAQYAPGGPLPDVFDPNFALGAQEAAGQMLNSSTAVLPWLLGISIDDANGIECFKSRGDAPLKRYHHAAYLVAIAYFSYPDYLNPNKTAWINPQLYSKGAWIAYLQSVHGGNIAALNTAWGTGGFYTSFGDAGGYGTGTGVLDEDGRHAWMGTDPFNLAGASAGVKADLDGFLYPFAKQYSQSIVSAVRSLDAHHLVLGPDALNEFGAKARDGVLKGVADGGIDAFMLGYDPAVGSLAGQMTENNQTYDLTSKPALIWYQTMAFADSALYTAPASAVSDFPTQAARGQHFANTDLPAFLGAAGGNGDRYVLGYEWWQLYDYGNINGLLTQHDNAYDGHEARIAPGTDAWGDPTGNERADWSDLLTLVTDANADVCYTLSGTTPGGPTGALAIKVHPNPWRADQNAGPIIFESLTNGMTVKIFTVSGQEVKELHTDNAFVSWDLTGASGVQVASGIYVYLAVDGAGRKATGKLGIIR